MAGAPRTSPQVSRPSQTPSGVATVLAFDYGEKRLGVAVGDAGLGIAHPLESIAAPGEARFASIAKLVAEWRPARLVVGLPVAETGDPHPLAPRVRSFARQLEARFRLPVAWVDERYSSVEAEARRSLRPAGRAPRAQGSSIRTPRS
jgi:putative holliday junction resolvase